MILEKNAAGFKFFQKTQLKNFFIKKIELGSKN